MRCVRCRRSSVFELEDLLLTALLLCALFCRGKLNIDNDSNHSLHVDPSSDNSYLYAIISYLFDNRNKTSKFPNIDVFASLPSTMVLWKSPHPDLESI